MGGPSPGLPTWSGASVSMANKPEANQPTGKNLPVAKRMFGSGRVSNASQLLVSTVNGPFARV